jgi:hypothetical protein
MIDHAHKDSDSSHIAFGDIPYVTEHNGVPVISGMQQVEQDTPAGPRDPQKMLNASEWMSKHEPAVAALIGASMSHLVSSALDTMTRVIFAVVVGTLTTYTVKWTGCLGIKIGRYVRQRFGGNKPKGHG